MLGRDALPEWPLCPAEQESCHHRTEIDKKICGPGQASSSRAANWSRTTPPPVSTFLPRASAVSLRGSVHCGEVTGDFVTLKSHAVGTKERVLTLCPSVLLQTKRRTLEKTGLQFTDTASRVGRDHVHTVEEKNASWDH